MNEFLSIRRLLTGSLLYLALPYEIFMLGYLRWPVAVLASIVLLLGIGCALWRERTRTSSDIENEKRARFVLTWKHAAAVLLTAFFLLVCSGVGGYGFQDGDWHKHNAMLSALIRHQWPVAYSVALAPQNVAIAQVPVVYYIAYYLPAALVGKAFGWFWANQALFLWTYIGLCLSICWFLALAQQSGIWLFVIFVAFSGLDVVGIILLRRFFLQEPLSIMQWVHIERWAGHWEYPAHVTSLFWAPNQGICAWLATGLLLNEFLRAGNAHRQIFFLSLTALWSPFVTLGLIPLLAADFFERNSPFSKKIAAYVAPVNLCGLFILLLTGVFYLSKFYPSPIPFVPMEQGFIFSSPLFPGLFWHEIALILALFCLLEYGGSAILIWRSRLPFRPFERRLFFISIAILSILPFFRYGFWNDLVMRVSLPALFIIAIFVTRALYAASVKMPVRILIIIALLLGSLNVAVELKRHIGGTIAAGKLINLPEPAMLYDVPNTFFTPSFFTQYIGSADSPFFNYFAKPPQPSQETLTTTTTKRKP